MLRRIASWTWRLGGGTLINFVLRRGGRTAVNTALGTAIPTQQSYTQVFNVTAPVTVYIRASNCRVSVRRDTAPKVTLQAHMIRAFGLEIAAEQDDAGVYIVAKRKPLVGSTSRADLTLTVPQDTHLAFHLTPGDVILQDIDGIFEVPRVSLPPES